MSDVGWVPQAVTRGAAADSWRLLMGVRVFAVTLCVSLSALTGSGRMHPFSTLGLVALAVSASILTRWRKADWWLPVVESALTAALILSTNPMDSTLLPYLLAPAMAAGLTAGFAAATTTAGVAALVIIVGWMFGLQPNNRNAATVDVAQWVALSFAVGGLAAWVRRLEREPSNTQNASYAAAYRLLSQLRVVSRQLSAGLDPVHLAQILLQAAGAEAGYERAGLFARTEGNRLVLLAYEGQGRPEGEPLLEEDSVWSEAWTSGRSVRASTMLGSLKPGYCAVVPLRVGERTVGLLGMERAEGPFDSEGIERVNAIAEEGALRLDAALLFSEVRSIATVEERRRLAREIHDGIAQELASLGYALDDLAAQAVDDTQLRQSIHELRAELTRMISELRLSIFDLRSEIESAAGLGSTLSDYVRWVGATSHLTVHLILDESPDRLRVDAETELLRIAQEAITNARKHAGALNLWVTCSVDPPAALLRVEDDGRGLGQARADSYGLEIMAERAQRIGGQLFVGGREGGGTLVEVTVGTLDSIRQTGGGTTAGARQQNERGAVVQNRASSR